MEIRLETCVPHAQHQPNQIAILDNDVGRRDHGVIDGESYAASPDENASRGRGAEAHLARGSKGEADRLQVREEELSPAWLYFWHERRSKPAFNTVMQTQLDSLQSEGTGGGVPGDPSIGGFDGKRGIRQEEEWQGAHQRPLYLD